MRRLELWCLIIFQLYRDDQFCLMEETGVLGENQRPVANHRLLFNAISAICQLYHGENKYNFNETMMMSALY
jgi:hypothetical protein